MPPLWLLLTPYEMAVLAAGMFFLGSCWVCLVASEFVNHYCSTVGGEVEASRPVSLSPRVVGIPEQGSTPCADSDESAVQTERGRPSLSLALSTPGGSGSAVDDPTTQT